MTVLDDDSAYCTKKAVSFRTGGRRPNEHDLNWIGKTCFCRVGETVPLDPNGGPMAPLATFARAALPWMPACLCAVEALALFISPRFTEHLGSAESEYCCVRTYSAEDLLVPCDWGSEYCIPFPLTPVLFDDTPHDWDGECHEAHYGHKLGGFPSYIQGEPDREAGFEFVLQISSDSKAGLNFVDGGNVYFFHNSLLNTWKVYCDFF